MRIYHGVASTGYIAGANDGIVTVKGKPASRGVYLINASTMKVEHITLSLPNGHYIFIGINPYLEYIVMARDHERKFEPFAWDFVKPSIDLTVDEQLALWQSWQDI